jgi:hypothetical protein
MHGRSETYDNLLRKNLKTRYNFERLSVDGTITKWILKQILRSNRAR